MLESQMVTLANCILDLHEHQTIPLLIYGAYKNILDRI